LPQVEIKLLQRYRVDRAAGGTADGSTQLVILVLKAHDMHECAFALSKADAIMLSAQMQLAAQDAQAVQHAQG
jgi:hypothetical protein